MPIYQGPLTKGTGDKEKKFGEPRDKILKWVIIFIIKFQTALQAKVSSKKWHITGTFTYFRNNFEMVFTDLKKLAQSGAFNTHPREPFCLLTRWALLISTIPVLGHAELWNLGVRRFSSLTNTKQRGRPVLLIMSRIDCSKVPRIHGTHRDPKEESTRCWEISGSVWTLNTCSQLMDQPKPVRHRGFLGVYTLYLHPSL